MLNRRILTIGIAILMATVATLPGLAVASDPNDQPYASARLQEVKDLNHLAPDAGRYSTGTRCWDNVCEEYVLLNQGDWVEYTFEFGVFLDLVRVYIPGFERYQGQGCTLGITSSLGNDYGTQTHACPNGDNGNEMRGHWYAVFFDHMFDSYTLRIECTSNCVNVGFSDVNVLGYFRELEMRPLEITTTLRPVTSAPGSILNGEYVSDTCVRVQVAGSIMYGVDYFRIDWGDGDFTYAEVPATWGKSFWDETFCHSYAPTLGEYYLTVFSHDRMDRLVKRHAYVDWL